MSTSQGVIFLKKKNVNGESKWFEDGDEENDGKYVGEIENGKPNGTGSITFPDGRKHVGEFKDGKPNGQGTLTLLYLRRQKLSLEEYEPESGNMFSYQTFLEINEDVSYES